MGVAFWTALLAWKALCVKHDALFQWAEKQPKSSALLTTMLLRLSQVLATRKAREEAGNDHA
jgi:hypothetical protein